jgi:uncharacterized protein YybS (DUF2232 family)
MMTRALMVVLGALAGYLLFGAAGALGAGAVLVNLFTPLPAAILGMRCGPLWAAATVALTALVVLVTADGPALLLYLLQFGVPAIFLPWLLTRGVSWDRAVFATLGLIVVLGLVTLFALASGAGQSPFTMMDSLVDQEISQTVTMMEKFAATPEQQPAELEEFRETVAGMGDFMRRVYPGMLVAVGGALQLVTIGLLGLLVRPARLPGPPFALWRAPELLIWVLIAAGFGTAFSAGVVQGVALNLLVILVPIYFLQGLAVVEYFLGRKRLSPLWRGVSYLLLLLVSPLPVIVTTVGIFDLWADFRKPRQSKE